MKIIGMTQSNKSDYPFLDGVVELKDIFSIESDFIVDVTNIVFIKDPREWLILDDITGAFYSDFYDKNGMYQVHGHFPSPRTYYPGLFIKTELAKTIDLNNSLRDLSKNYVISYIPEPLFKMGN